MGVAKTANVTVVSAQVVMTINRGARRISDRTNSKRAVDAADNAADNTADQTPDRAGCLGTDISTM
jgi:hypothetical protein